jgi:hypothetical protein
VKGARLQAAGTVAGVVVGCLIASSLVATGTLKVPVRRDTRDASADFLAAWERSRMGTFVVESDFRRTLKDGRTLYSATLDVQRPPDHLRRQFGGISGSIGGHPIVCSTEQTGRFSCAAGSGSAPKYEDVIARELDAFRTYFTAPAPGALPLYRVIHAPDGGCFELFDTGIPYPLPPYGHYSKFCFDRATGAVSMIERQLDDGVVETTEASSIRGEVAVTDFDTSQDRAFDTRMDLGETPEPSPITTAPPADPSGPLDPKQLSNRELIERGSQRVGSPDESTFVDTAVARLEAGTLSINDLAWRTSANETRALLRPVVLALLLAGYYLPPY